MKSALFPRFGENLRPVWRFWQLWPSQMRFGQNVLRMTWKERFVQFSWKAHPFSFFARISGQCDYFENFDAQKCDLAKTCCAWPENSVLSNFHGERTVFPFWRDFEASFLILITLTVKNAIWPKRAAHDLKKGFCTIFMKSALFSLFWKEFKASMTILTTLTLTNSIWPKRAAHDLKRGFCTIFMKSALFSRCGEKLRPVWRFWELWRLKMRFDQNVLRITWKERCVQFSWKAHGFPVLKRIWGQCDDFENFDAHKFDLAKTSCAWPEKSVLYNFHGKRTVFPFWSEFQASVNFDAQKCDLAKTCCAWPEKSVVYNFRENALFCRFEENLRQV